MFDQLTVVDSEYRIVSERAGWAELPAGILRVGGAQAVPWLHKLITADVEHLGPGQGVRSALLNAKGHLVAEFLILRRADDVLLMTGAEEKENLRDALLRYRLRAKVDIYDESDRWRLVTIIGSQAEACAAQLFGRSPPAPTYSFVELAPESRDLLIKSRRAPQPSVDLLLASADGPAEPSQSPHPAFGDLPQLSPELVDLMRIEAGLPEWSRDFDSSTLPLELPDLIDVRVDQGCYVGQEVVARIVHRGHVNRRLVGLKLDPAASAAAGDPVERDGEKVGNITSAARSPRLGPIALGYVRREASGPGTLLQVRGLPVQVSILPF